MTNVEYYVEFKRTIDRVGIWFKNGPYLSRNAALNEVDYLHRIGFNARLQGE